MANLFSKELIRREANAAYYPNGLLTMEELTQAQVDAACRLHAQHLPGWQRSDSSLNRLNELTPRFSPEVCLLKSATINAVYGTQVLAIMQMAAHVTNVLQQADLDRAGTELVEMIADLRLSRGKKRRRRTSFASKFCHFFVDPERFPIYDDAAKQALKLHLGRKRAHDDAHPIVRRHRRPNRDLDLFGHPLPDRQIVALPKVSQSTFPRRPFFVEDCSFTWLGRLGAVRRAFLRLRSGILSGSSPSRH